MGHPAKQLVILPTELYGLVKINYSNLSDVSKDMKPMLFHCDCSRIKMPHFNIHTRVLNSYVFNDAVSTAGFLYLSVIGLV